MGELPRRRLLGSALGGPMSGLAGVAHSQQAPVPVIDCHIHLFDQTRPQGAPYWAGPKNKEPSLPARYRSVAAPLGIVGAIHVEASPWIEDNLWALQVQEAEPMMLGMIGNLQPEKPEFREYLERYHRNRLFLGIRYGNLWGYSLVDQLANPAFVEGLKLLAQAGLTLDTANPRPDLLAATLRVSDRVQGLRIVVDHLPGMLLRMDAKALAGVEGTLRELAKRPPVFIKVSQMLRTAGGKAVTDAAVYRPALDQIFETFGEDKLIFGSDWPNSDAVDNLASIVRIARDYFLPKGPQAAGKYFWKNSQAAYRWVKRGPGQPQA